MRILGPAQITNTQQKLLVEGAVLEIPICAVYESAAKKSDVGDVFWVREPYFEWTPPRHNAPQYLRAVMHGHSPIGLTIPKSIKPYFQRGRMIGPCRASSLTRTDSRASLEIISIMPGKAGWRCKATMGNVDGIESDAA